MSVEIVLIPLALAAAQAVATVGGGVAGGVVDRSERICLVQTRLKHSGLLVEALQDLGASAEVTATGVRGTRDGLDFAFVHHEDGTLTAQFPPLTDEDLARDFVLETDAAYALRVQATVHERIRQRAGELGMTIEAEHVDPEHGITLVLDVDGGR
ncbi:MAG: hypothetical protein ACT4QF_21700 [Sporichthyaceae bacterium]